MINQEINKIQSQLTKAEAEFRRDAAVLSHLHDQVCCEFDEPALARAVGVALTTISYIALSALVVTFLNCLR